ncbi:FIG01269488: protein, clustered with ribosomal protein L32p [uncultured Gammaproteobacteria bacterium]|jgi:uncharacterized protein|uniref:FIG01269488: protein, clustered with ribosomal protein L32p n=4 Tax=sulfur-oxidizing symbionts TaxID=32036 RepID=A0ACA8ZT76_9GAMM|nr:MULTISPECIES: YceD family protein [sulfur-oxidizing symbionts]CAC5862205.1 FIG01269488: protein, clustered with ribosomal protein L32p [uncultured Gammaproteobacteria bacterium]CAB5502735.1 FIG01269488: protein, clustered with ribosomal protein L32p [Bathymodiolus thermophilus thioautotrophic gill symbiont]CAB5507304.1 FIG01269488: protein, clustered with ribosomal protein L32p [Bathymodiolus azoricus thioautotrophic gill symbiont]CAC9498835.1 FIG01269488: protein, clustered with ribosomal p
MKQGIPKQIKLFKFAFRSLIFSQTYKVKDLPRIRDLVSNQDSTVDVKLSFNLEYGRIPCIKGEIKLDLALTCQRCLDEVKLHLEPKFQLAFVQNEQQGEELDSSFEMILSTEDEFSTIEFITDEVLISIPMTPMHGYECVSYQNTQLINKQKRENPFAILEQLKTTKE